MTAEDLLRSAFKYQDALVSYAYGLLQDWALAQDAVQEAFIVLQKKHAEYRPDANVYTWARQIVRFEALNILRSRQREAYFVNAHPVEESIAAATSAHVMKEVLGIFATWHA